MLAVNINSRSGVRVEISAPSFELSPTPMDEVFQEQIARASETHAPGKWRRMPSGAGHDAIMARRQLPCGMLFIPSIDGISHSFSEDTNEEDIALGCQVLADAAVSVLRAASS